MYFRKIERERERERESVNVVCAIKKEIVECLREIVLETERYCGRD